MREYVGISMFKEQMRKLKLPAMILTVLAAFGLIMELILITMMGYGGVSEWLLPSAWIVYLAPIVALILSEILMKDFRTRNGSDFYHALPVSKRITLLSAVVAVLCWTFVYMIIPVLIQALLIFILSYRPMDWSIVFEAYTFGTIVSFYLISAAWLGHVLTGTRMSQVVISVMIIAGPRTLLYVIGMIIETTMPYMFLDRYDFLFRPQKYNFALNFFIRNGRTVTSVIYTILLSLIYLGLALWLVRKKPSEVAGRPTWTSKMETLVRVLLAFALSLPAIIGCLLLYFSNSGYGSFTETSKMEYMMLIILFYSLAVIVYFLYEIVQTKKVKNSFKHWKGLGWVALFNLIIILGIVIVHKSVSGLKPDPTGIESVSLVDVRDRWDYFREDGEFAEEFAGRIFIDEKNDEIYQGMIYDIPLTSDYVKSTVSDELRNAILEGNDYYTGHSYIKTRNLQEGIGGPARDDWTNNDLKIYSEVMEEIRHKAVVKIKLTNGKTIYRQLNLPRKLFAELTKRSEFVEKVQKLDFERIVEFFKVAWGGREENKIVQVSGGEDLYDKDNRLIEALKSDIKAMTGEQKRDLLFHSTKCVYGKQLPLSYDWIRVSYIHFESNSAVTLSVSSEICPSFFPYVEESVKTAYTEWELKEEYYNQLYYD